MVAGCDLVVYMVVLGSDDFRVSGVGFGVPWLFRFA